MVHDYVQDPAALAAALNEAHSVVPLLVDFAVQLRQESLRRGFFKAAGSSNDPP
jgi:hypothetical protein